MLHVAIIHQSLLADLLAGRKSIESRFSRARRTPFGEVRVGERVYFKVAGGGYGATALVSHVESFERLRTSDVSAIRRLYNDRIRATPEYWQRKLASRFATLIWLSRIEATEMGPVIDDLPHWQPRSAWGVFSESLDVYPPMIAA